MAKTYWIARVDLTGDAETYKKYVETATPAFQRHKAKFLARGGKTEVLEGDYQPNRIVILKFPSIDRAKEWLNCGEYREPRKLRHKTAKTNMIVVEGLDQPLRG